METSIPPADSASALPHVSWQTIFWTLVPLAINSMSQPGGRVCGLPSRYRTYLRCSPFVCFADSISNLMWMVTLVSYQKVSFMDALGILLHKRFSESGVRRILAPNEFETEGIQVLERMTWLRWLWFVLGTLPPAIKLLAMSGVGWAQVWGILFLSSWLLNEFLVIFATLNQDKFTISRSGVISWPGYEQSTTASGYKQIDKLLSFADITLAVIALNAHIVMMNGVFRVVSRTTNAFPLGHLGYYYPLAASNTLEHTSTSTPTITVSKIVVETITARPWFSSPPWPNPTFASELDTPPYVYDHYTAPDYQLRVIFVLLMGIIMLNVLYPLRTISLPLILFSLFYLMIANSAANLAAVGTLSYTELYVFSISFLLIPFFILLLRYLARQSSVLGQNLLVMSRDEHGDLRVDYGGCLALVFFLCTGFATLVWYCYVFDASGTSVPVWTGVFG